MVVWCCAAAAAAAAAALAHPRPPEALCRRGTPLAATCFICRVDFFVTSTRPSSLHSIILASAILSTTPFADRQSAPLHPIPFIIPKGFNNEPPTPLKDPTTPDLNRE